MTQVVPLQVHDNEAHMEGTDLVEKSAEEGRPDVQEDPKRTKESARRKRRLYCTIFKALLTRVLFVTHSLVAVWRAAEVAGIVWWGLLGALALLLIETVITLAVRKGKEWKWFCPSVLFFLLGSVPAIWLLELDRFSSFNKALNNTIGSVSTDQGSGLVITLPISVDNETWVMAIEQSLMILLIIGRWLLPKGSMTRDELSALLLVYVGLAADIIELFDIFDEEKVLRSHYFIYTVLGVYSLSLLQFVFVVGAIGSGQGTRLSDVDETDEPIEPNMLRRCFCNWEVWSIIWSVLLQDGPFLAIRLAAIILFQVYTYSNFFFLAKNFFVVVLQGYRLVAVTCCAEEEDDEDEKEKII